MLGFTWRVASGFCLLITYCARHYFALVWVHRYDRFLFHSQHIMIMGFHFVLLLFLVIFLWDKILFGFLRFCLIVHYLRCPKFCWSSRFIPLLVFRIRFKGRKMLIVYPFCLFLQLIPRCCFPLQDFSNFNSKVYTISIPTCTSFPT